MKIQDMNVFKKAHQITLDIYRLTLNFPEQEKFTLTRQMRRAASSIPMTLSEGSVKATDKDKERFFNISLGSCAELIYQIKLSKDLKYIDNEIYKKLNDDALEIKKMLYGLKKYLHKDK